MTPHVVCKTTDNFAKHAKSLGINRTTDTNSVRARDDHFNGIARGGVAATAGPFISERP